MSATLTLGLLTLRAVEVLADELDGRHRRGALFVPTELAATGDLVLNDALDPQRVHSLFERDAEFRVVNDQAQWAFWSDVRVGTGLPVITDAPYSILSEEFRQSR
ncbi:MAG: hypothetical protein H8E44_28910 [Planctomycetes bacterium]|nr:hypothetical protein [Planctomycetota bacterium]MBL7043920.1 hypothetical protein [Pirellulaceae bacterium]